MGILLVLPFIPSDFAWRFQLTEFLPVFIIIGYACARVKRSYLPLLVVFILVTPVALMGFQSANTLTPTITTQGYADLQHMATLVSSNDSVLVVQGMGMAYWPEFILNLPVASNSTVWLQAGYNVYLLVDAQGQPRIPNNSPNLSGGTVNGTFAASGAFNDTRPFGQQGPPGQQGQPGMPNGGNPSNGGPQNSGTEDLQNATLLYSGTIYSLYQLQHITK